MSFEFDEEEFERDVKIKVVGVGGGGGNAVENMVRNNVEGVDEIRAKKPPEPYKGKGIRYEGEVVKHKEGKAGKGKK